MTPNDAQIDVLLRRHAGQAKRNPATEHLDADELNAFAEGSLPAAARSRYVSHLADCDDCRRVASQLAITTGAVVVAEATTAGAHGYSWWKRLSGFFSPLTLRYAAFAMVLIAVVGVAFLVTRRSRETSQNLIAQGESADQQKGSAVKPAEPAGLQARTDQTENRGSESASPAAATPMVSKPDESKDAGSYLQPSPKPEQETAKAVSPALAAEKAAEPKSLPYSPPPPGENTRSETASNKGQTLPGDVASGPRKSESSYDKFKMTDRSRARDTPGETRAQDDNARFGVTQHQAKFPQANVAQANVQREADEKAARGRDAEVQSSQSSRDRNVKESQAQAAAPETQRAVTAKRAPVRAPAEEAPETRSVGGRKFRRQGDAWVDAKFKSSMTLKSISRGSDEFAALDSGLRSIAQQISGEVIVVWKGKAYLIR